MDTKTTAIHRSVQQAIDRGAALSVGDIRRLRRKSRESITGFKVAFWVAIGIFNLILWVPMPIDRSILLAAAVLSLLFAFVAPVVGIRIHNRRLASLQEVSPGPKKRRASEAARNYIEQVREEGRGFVKAEVEVLEESRSGGDFSPDSEK